MEGEEQMPVAVESMEGVLMKSGTAHLQGPMSRLDAMVLQVRNGETEAFDELMLETEQRVLRLAWRLLGDRELAKDTCQEVFLRAYKSLASYRIGESFTAWVLAITANICRDYLKMKGFGATDPQILESMPALNYVSADDLVLQNQHREMVQKALSALTPAERLAVVLRDLEGLSTDETADRLGLKAGTVRAQISTARSKIRAFCRRILHKTTDGGRP